MFKTGMVRNGQYAKAIIKKTRYKGYIIGQRFCIIMVSRKIYLIFC